MQKVEETHKSLDITYINNGQEILPYILNEDQHAAVMEVWKTYNPLTGPVQNAGVHHSIRGASPVYIGHCEYYNVDDIMQKILGLPSMVVGTKNSLFAGGKGITLPNMLLGSISETIERILGTYSDFEEDESEVIYGTFNSLKAKGINCIEPGKLPLFHEEQYKEENFPYKPFTPESMLGWVKGKGLVSGKDIYLPAQLVKMYHTPRRDEDHIGYSTTGGLDSHVNMYEGIYHGICELIERDGVNVRWVCGIPPEQIILKREEVASPELGSLLDSFGGLPVQLKYYYHSLDINEVSVVTAIFIDECFNRFSYYPGGGADADIENAIVRAINEFAQAEKDLRLALLCPTRLHTMMVNRVFGLNEDDPVSKIDLFFKIVSYYGYKRNIRKLDWYLKGNEAISLKAIPSQTFTDSRGKYDFILNVMEKHHIDPIFFDCTPATFKTLKLVKVFIPELTLPFISSSPYLGHSRYRELPKRMGLSDRVLTYEDFVKDPHPYP